MIILTDLSEVLIRGIYGVQELIKEIYGEEVAQRFWARHQEMDASFCDLMRGFLTEDAYWRMFFATEEWPFYIEEIEWLFSRNLSLEIPKTLDTYRRIMAYPRKVLKPGTRCDSAMLKVGRPEIWIVSDHIEERRPEIGRLHPEVFNLVSRKIWSFEEGFIKSDPEFFPRILMRYGIQYDEAIFVDDREENIAAANVCGITGILFENAYQLETELKQRGFVFETVKRRR